MGANPLEGRERGAAPRMRRPRKWFCPSQALQALLGPRAPKLTPPARLEAQAMYENFVLRQDDHGKAFAAAQVQRVLQGLMPMACIELRRGTKRKVSERPLRKVVASLGLGCEVVLNHQGVTEAIVFQRGASLGDFYDPALAVALFAGARASLSEEAFRTPLEALARRLSNEDFGADIKHPMLGLCKGYPLHEAVAMLDPRLRRL